MTRLRRTIGRERGYTLVEMLIVLSILTTVMAGLTTLFDPDALAACVAEGVREQEPVTASVNVRFTNCRTSSPSAVGAAVRALGVALVVLKPAPP